MFLKTLFVIYYLYKLNENLQFIPQKHNIYYQYSIETPVTK